MTSPGEAANRVICRICTASFPPEAASNLFECRAADGYSLAEVVSLVGDISVLADEKGLPVWCCFQCQLDVEMAYRVRVLCQESDRKLREMLEEAVDEPEGAELTHGWKMEIEESTIGSPERNELADNQESEETTEKDLVCKFEVEEPRLSVEQESDEKDLIEQQDSDILEVVPCLKTRCCGCRQFFDTRQEMLDHAKREHAVGDPPKRTKNRNPCDVCFQTVKRQYLQRHQETPKTMFRCKACGELFERANSVRPHHIMHHYVYQNCCSCNIKFDTVEALREHSDLVHLPNKRPVDKDRPFVCNVCYLMCRTSSHLYEHRVRGGFKLFQCSQCKRSFSGPSVLKRHEASHQKSNAFRCSICSKPFRNYDTLRVHIADHRMPNRFKCEPCNKVYKSRPGLAQHNISLHGAQGNFQCQFCPASFVRLILLNGHEKRFHKAKLQKIGVDAGHTKKRSNELSKATVDIVFDGNE